MIVRDKKHMTWGVVMTLIFVLILGFMFTKMFQGRKDAKINAFKASDNLFNSIAKGSTNYFPMLLEENKKLADQNINLQLEDLDQAVAERSLVLLRAAGVTASKSNNGISIQGELSRILEQALQDSKVLFDNQSQELQNRYNLQGREVVYVWWQTLTSLEKALTQAKEFAAAKFVGKVVKRGVEVGYNFYGIPSESAAHKAGILSFSLIFYVLYTLLWGFSIFFVFEGLGLRMSSGAKKEV